MSELSPGFGVTFDDLHTCAGLERLDARFLAFLAARDADLSQRLREARGSPQALADKALSELLIDIAGPLEDFVAVLFGIEAEVGALQQCHTELAPLYRVKRTFVQRRAARALSAEATASLDGAALLCMLALPEQPDSTRFELAFAKAVTEWERDAVANASKLEAALRYAAWALLSERGRALHGAGVLFQVPKKLDPAHLVALEPAEVESSRVVQMPATKSPAQRDGFNLTDAGCTLEAALDEAHYCIACHNQGKDSCSKGFREPGGNGFKRNALGVPLTGCPLEERISEFQVLKSEGRAIGALAMIMIDNPMVAATGHRICNDCMKACIYQKQAPVDIPQAETRTLKDVLALPWGFEIYSLLSRWNPLNLARPLPRAPSGHKVLVVGLGPAGFTLTHHLLNDGHTVVAIDGLKIEPLPSALSGVNAWGRRVPFAPIEEESSLHASLSERVMAGFGGVAEYGITVRWDKNFLTLVRLLLERRSAFSMIGGVRFGGTLTIEDAFAAGFDHIALCMGAGRPTVIPLANGLARGVRQASDFLMALQLTGAARRDSIANLQVRLPILVIGGGLTAVDTATESLAYYPVQVERFLLRFEALEARQGAQAVRARWTEEERQIAAEFLTHARAIRAEKKAAAEQGRAPRVAEMLRQWGGVTIAYRRGLTDAPCYRLNHEEVAHALREGVQFLENALPIGVETDAFGHARRLRFQVAGIEQSLPARTILVAAGTQPNTVLAGEQPDYLASDGRYFQAIDEHGVSTQPMPICKPDSARVLTSRHADGRFVSFFGDLHPSFAGNVVKAMASAKQGSGVISACLAARTPTAVAGTALIEAMNQELRAVVDRVVRLTPTIVEVVVRAPRAARRFQPGQFFRLQNFETCAPRIEGTLLTMEAMALTGASVDRERGLVSLIVLEMGGSSDLCRILKPGHPVVLMGPTGQATAIPRNETLCLVGGGLGNAVLFSIGQAARARGNRVIYFAGYKTTGDRYKTEQIEAAADQVIWSCDTGPGFEPGRPQDRTFVGNVVDAMQAYASGALGAPDIDLRDVSRLIVIGSDRMMAAVAAARHACLAPYLAATHEAVGSINSPMQCMMKEICGQCLQRHHDRATGRDTVVFSCANQDQLLDRVDFASLHERLAQNSVHEKLTAAWVSHCLAAASSP